ncbi:MAG: acetate--CoA ligase family protein [Syntrophobacteraceae bacterium]|jgi:acetyltransferase
MVNDLFYPESIVVVGVSESRDNLGRNVVANLVNLGYQGKIYAVGPRGGEVFGHPIYRSIAELPGNPGLAVILTPARVVHNMLAQCGEKGTRWAVIESAGFRELGTEGEILEREILQASKRFGLRFVGPNCVGTANTANGLYTEFVTLGTQLRKGKIGVFAQSGGVGLCLVEKLSYSGVGISKFASIGNKLDLDEADYLAYVMDDPETSVIYFYLEGFKRGRAFADLARRCCKPIILHKSNTGALSSTIAQSHTAALAADDQVVDAVCRESGILRVHSVTEAVSAAKGLSLPPLKGKNLAVISRSGGHAVVTADVCAKYGFRLPPLGRDILDEAQSRSRAGVIRLGNPLDLGDIFDLSFWISVVEKILQQHDIDGMVFILVSHMAIEKETIRRLVEKLFALSLQSGKPIATVMEIPFDERVHLAKTSNFPFFLETGEAVKALAVLSEWSKTDASESLKPHPDVTGVPFHDTLTIPVQKIEKWFSDIERQNRQPLLHEALDLLDLTGIPTVPWRMANSLDKALEASENLGFPVALKAVSPSLLHKSDKGGLALDVRDAKSLRNEWHRLQKVSDDIAGIVVQKMAPASRELVVGGKRDPLFGPVVLTGLGGIMVEVMKDVSMRLAPIDTDAAMEMLGELSGKRILGRFRGMPEADLKAAARILVQVSLLMHHFPQIREMDLNPVSLGDEGSGAVALDVRLLM